MPNKWQGSRWRKLLLIVVLALVAFEVVYAIAINVLLRSGHVARWMNQSTEDIHIEIDSGWSLWPGRVHAGEVRFRFEDRNLQFYVVLERAVVDIRLRELPAKTVHLSRVRGEGTRYLFRHKVDSAAGLERRLARYPSIPGFSDPPLFTEPPKPPLGDEEYNLWTVALSDVDVQVSELWFQEYRFRGKGRARGGFRLQPQRDAWTKWCQLDLSGTLGSGPDVVLRDMVGKLEVQLDRHDPRQVEGEQIFGKISVSVDLGAEVHDLNVSELYTKPNGLKLRRGAGKLALEADYQRGAWVKDSHLSYETRGLTLKQDELTISAAGDFEAKIIDGDRNSRMRLSFASPRVQLGYHGVPEGLDEPFARGVYIALVSTADLMRPQRWTALSADLRPVVPDARWLNHAFDRRGLFSGGGAEAELHAEWRAPAPASAELHVAMQALTLVPNERSIELSGKLDAQASYDPRSERGEVRSLTVSLPQFQVADSILPEGIQIRSHQLHWQGLPPQRTEARLEFTSADIDPLLPLAVPSGILRGLVNVLVHLGKTRAVFEFEQTPADWELRMTEARSGNVTAVGQLLDTKGSPHPCGSWFIQAGRLRAGVLVEGGKTTVKPLVSPAWWRERPVPTCAGER